MKRQTLNAICSGIFCAFFATTSWACSLQITDETLVRKKMAAAIADHLAWGPDRVDINDITTPVLNQPLPLGADCSGLPAFHHSAGFSIESGQCTYQGVAVLMGYWYYNPVAVNYTIRC